MAQIAKRRGNGDGSSFPTWRNSLFPSRFFNTGLTDFDDLWNRWNTGASMPPANIEETDKEFRLDLFVPGMKKEDFKIDAEHGVLSVSSESSEENTSEEKNYSRREFSYSSFSRSFTLPENVNEDKISAKYQDGVLHVTIPKKEVAPAAPKKQIKID